MEDDAEAPDVGAAVDRLTGGLFGAHVAGGAEDEAGFGGAHAEGGRFGRGRAGGLFGGLSEAEIEDFDDAFGGDDDVAGFEVSVDDAFFVGGFEGFGDLPGEGEGFGEGQGAFEGLAFD